MDTQSSDQDRQDTADQATSAAAPTPPADDGRFSVPWALPDEDDTDER